MVGQFARQLDPTFDPPMGVVLEKRNSYAHAYGCGGGEEVEKRGDETRGVLFRDEIEEGSADSRNDGSWKPYGLAPGCELLVHRYEYTAGVYSFSATGPTPAVLDIAALWGQMTREGMDVWKAQSQLPSRPPPPSSAAST